MKDFSKYKSNPSDTFFVDKMDEDQDGTGGWGIFGDQSGFCYGIYGSEKEALSQHAKWSRL